MDSLQARPLLASATLSHLIGPDWGSQIMVSSLVVCLPPTIHLPVSGQTALYTRNSVTTHWKPKQILPCPLCLAACVPATRHSFLCYRGHQIDDVFRLNNSVIFGLCFQPFRQWTMNLSKERDGIFRWKQDEHSLIHLHYHDTITGYSLLYFLTSAVSINPKPMIYPWLMNLTHESCDSLE